MRGQLARRIKVAPSLCPKPFFNSLLELYARDFPGDWDFVIVYGPNGVGKTKLLESVKSLLSLETYALWRAPFAELHLNFDDGHELVAVKPYMEPGSWTEEEEKMLLKIKMSNKNITWTNLSKLISSKILFKTNKVNNYILIINKIIF